MASNNEFLTYVLELLREVSGITYKIMMGEYILYKDDKIFCFQLNSLEFKTLKSQNATSNIGRGGKQKLPFVYTEHGIIALAGVLKSEIADKMSVEIARKFIQMRKFILENGDVLLAGEFTAQVQHF